MIRVRRLDSKVSVTGQLRPADVEELAHHGFRLLINGRPDGESFLDQPSMAAIEDASEACGVETRYLPITLGTLSALDVRRFHDLVEAAPGPVLAYCKTGFHSAVLWALAEAAYAGRDLQSLLGRAKTEGFDLSSHQALIDRVLVDVSKLSLRQESRAE